MHSAPGETSTIPHDHPTHEHAWLTESAHRTSDGRVLYVRCVSCGVRRVDITTRDDEAPTAISVSLRD